MAYTIPQPNQSVSGVVGASIIGYPNVNVGGSVVATQGTSPWVIAPNNSSIIAVPVGSTISYVQNSVATVIIGGSIAVATGNSSVQLVGGTALVGSVLSYLDSTAASVITVNKSSSVVAVVTGSVVSIPVGSTISYIQNSVATVIIGGSVAAGTQYLENQIIPSVTGTAVMFKSNISSSIMSVVTPTTPLPIIGSVATLQGTTPWQTIVGGSVITVFQDSSIISINKSSSIIAIVTGSVALASSVITVPIGSVITVFQSASLLAVQSGTRITSIAGILENTIQASTTGIPVMFKTNVSTSTIGVVSTNNPLPIIGSVAALQGTNPWFIATPAGSVQAVRTDNASVILGTGTLQIGSVVLSGGVNAIGSVATLQGTNPWITVNPAGSVTTVALNTSSLIAVPVGSTITVLQTPSLLAVQSGTWKTSIASNYASNSASIVSGLGMLGLGVRNDTLSSTLANANGSYSPFTVGSWGDQIVSLAPSSAWTSGIGSVFTGTPQPIITSVSGMFLNVTAVQITNQSANNAYLTFYGTGLGSVASSVIAYSAVPASGGSNILYPIPLRTAQSQPFQASVSGVASVYLSAQGFYSKV